MSQIAKQHFKIEFHEVKSLLKGERNYSNTIKVTFIDFYCYTTRQEA